VSTTTLSKSKKSKTKFSPAPGDDFEIYPANPEVFFKAVGDLDTTRTRNFIAIMVIVFLLASLAASGLYGLLEGHIGIVAATWTAILSTLTLVLSFYFKRRIKLK
jgi:hypothetical protein